jgi:hypothetical protein
MLRVTRSVYEGHLDEPKTARIRRSVPLGAKSIEILLARKPVGMDPEDLTFAPVQLLNVTTSITSN